MRCNDVRQRVEQYVAGKLSDADLKAMDKHLDYCETCVKMVDDYLKTKGLAEPMSEDEELLRLMRMPTPSPERVQAGVAAVLRDLERVWSSVPPREAVDKPWTQRLRDRLRRPATYAYVLAGIMVLALGIFAWKESQLRAVSVREREALIAKAESLQSQNAALKEESEKLTASHQRTQQQLTSKLTMLEQKIAQLQKRAAVQRTVPSDLLASLEELATKGIAPLAESAGSAIAILRRAAETARDRGELKGDGLVPLSPILTVVRSARPTLKWQKVAAAQKEQKYEVTVVDRDDNPIWTGSVATTQVTLPPDKLKPGQIFFWQVETSINGKLLRSPEGVGFWVLDEESLREVEAAERNYKTSALALVTVYEKYGLYEEALMQVERLKKKNPNNPLVPMMLKNLRRQ